MNAGLGHNNPPPYDATALAKLDNDTAAFIQASNAWLAAEVDSDEKAEKLSDQITGLRALFKRADEARKADKKPHDDAGSQVQKAYAPILDKITKCADLLKPRLAKYVADKAAAEATIKAEAAAAARAAAEAASADKARAEAEGDIGALVEAEAAEKAAAADIKAASSKVARKIGSASGAGRTMALRSRKVCTLTAINAAFATFRDDPAMAELLVRLANQRANAAGFEGGIPGFTIETVNSIA